MKKWELELENENLKKNCKMFLKENEILKIRIEKLELLHKWHYISEEGLPEKADYYFIAYDGGVLGLCGTLCRLVEGDLSHIKKWYHPEPKIMEELNKEGFVYAWMIPPALPEVK